MFTIKPDAKLINSNKSHTPLYSRQSPKTFIDFNWNSSMTWQDVQKIKLLMHHGAELNSSLIKYIFKPENIKFAQDLLIYYITYINNTQDDWQICFFELLECPTGPSELKIFQLLIDHGMPINTYLQTVRDSFQTPLTLCILKQKVDYVSILLRSNAEVNMKLLPALHIACKVGEPKIVRMLLDYGADVYQLDNLGNSVLHVAAQVMTAEPDISKMLLEYGMNVDTRNKWGETALHAASRAGFRPKIVQLLLKYGADVNIKSFSKNSALFLAVQSCLFRMQSETATIHMLLEHGANVNLKNLKGQTVLHVAAQLGNSEILHSLLEKGADINVLDETGKTPLQLSSKSNYALIKEVAKLEFKHDLGDAKNLKFLLQDENSRKVFDQCMIELNKMNGQKIYNSISLYDILQMSPSKLLKLAKNEEFVAEFVSGWTIVSFKYYGMYLDDIFKGALVRRDALFFEEEKLFSIFNDYLPVTVIEKVAFYSFE